MESEIRSAFRVGSSELPGTLVACRFQAHLRTPESDLVWASAGSLIAHRLVPELICEFPKTSESLLLDKPTCRLIFFFKNI